MTAPFVVAVYDKAFNRKGWIGDPLAVRAVPRHNLLPTAEVTIRSDHSRAADVLADGARLVITYDGEHLIGGPVRKWTGEGPAATSTITVAIEDDWRLLSRLLAWPVPGAALSAQSVAYDERSGAAETVFKAYVSANATRLGLPVTVATDLGRGATKSNANRFHPLTDRLLPMVESAGLGVTVQQSGAGFLVDVYVPQVYPRTLTEASGVVQGWEYTRTAPTVTRVIAGNQGEAEARSFRTLIDSARETAWADKIEVFLDARDTTDTTETDQRMQELLDEGAPKAGLSVELAETDTFRYGTAVHVGDQVSLEVGPGLVVSDVLREATLTWTREDGLLVSPTVGERITPEALVPRAVRALTRTVRNLTRS